MTTAQLKETLRLMVFATGALAAEAHADNSSPSVRQLYRATVTFDGLRPLLAAIRQVETGGLPDGSNPDAAAGDAGRSRGAYQMSKAYWADACRAAGVAWPYEPGHRARCEVLMYYYWRKYAPKALATGNWQTLARIHNGGPKGARIKSTRAYWKRVEAAMAGSEVQ